MLYAGLDLSRKRLDFHLLDEAGGTVEADAALPDADGCDLRPGLRAFLLEEEAAGGPAHDAAARPRPRGRRAVLREQHPGARMGLIPQTAMMVYGTRDDDGLDIV